MKKIPAHQRATMKPLDSRQHPRLVTLDLEQLTHARGGGGIDVNRPSVTGDFS